MTDDQPGTLTDIMKTSTMLIVSRWLLNEEFDQKWQLYAFSVLLGYTIYNLVVKRIYYAYDPAIYDILKYSTMLITVRLIHDGSLFEAKWIYVALSVLLGYTVFNIFLRRKVLSVKTGRRRLDLSVYDWAKYGTMLIILQVALQLMDIESLTDPKWVAHAVAKLLGYTVYNCTLA